MPGFDMHIHSTASDGQLDVVEVIDLARTKDVAGIAITDHDTVEGLPRALAYAKSLDFPLIPGIELSTEYENRDVHILGYWIDVEKIQVSGRLQEIGQARQERCRQIVRRLAALGMELDADAIIAAAKDGKSLGRPHVALAMVEANYVATLKEAFNKWLGRGMPAYVARPKFTPREAIALVQAADGVAVLAHPGISVPDYMLQPLIRLGLGGIEVYHSEHNKRAEQKYLQIARRYRLAAMGGSDFHLPGVRDIGSRTTSIGQLERLAEARMRLLAKKGGAQ